MEAALAELEKRQTRILLRIQDLELSHHLSSSLSLSSPPADDDHQHGDDSYFATVERLSGIIRSKGILDFVFKLAPSDYYDRPLEARRDIVGAASIHHLCKSIVLVNTQAQSHVIDCSDRNNSKYYIVVVQYTARFNAEMVKNFLYSINNGKVPKKKINLRLAPEEISANLTGYGHNAVTCIGMKTNIPVILDEAITKLSPNFFWLGGGEVDLKMGIQTSDFIRLVDPFICSCSSV
ncbi:hypothetical protein V2J09_011545 [Rumex salicifolius]